VSTNKIGLKNPFIPTAWNKDAAKPAPTKAPPAPAKDGWYQNSFAAQGSRTGQWSTGWGSDTTGLFDKTPGKPNLLTKLLDKLPAWEKKGQFDYGVAAKVKEGQFSALGGLATGQGRISVLEASVHGQGKVSFKKGALTATGDLQAQATLVDASGHLHLGKGDYNVDVKANAFVGAKAAAHGELTIDPRNGVYAAKVGGEAFVGARAGIEGQANLGKFGAVGGKAEAWAGVGVAFHAEAGYKDGRFKARFDIGAALGIGFKLGFNVNINVKGIADAIKHPFAKIGDAIKNKIGEAKKAVSKAVDQVKNVANKAVDTVKSAAKKVGNFFKKLF
jgi:hypothetical protein